MGAGEIIAIVMIAAIIGGAVWYIVKAKKSGRKCIGCPDSCSCSAKNAKDQNAKCNGECSCCNKD